MRERTEYTGQYDLTDKDTWAAVQDRLKNKIPGLYGRVVLFCDPIHKENPSDIPRYANVLFHGGNYDSDYGTIKLQGRSTGRQQAFRQMVEHYAKHYSKIKIIDLQMESNETKIPHGSYQIRPNHYGGKSNPLEAIKIIDHYGLGFNLGNAVKYILRCGKKDSKVNELRKAITYLEFELEKALADVDSVPMTPKEVFPVAPKEPIQPEELFDGQERFAIRQYAEESIKKHGHQVTIEQYIHNIEVSKKETPVNLYKVNALIEGLRFTREHFDKFKAKADEYNENQNTNGRA